MIYSARQDTERMRLLMCGRFNLQGISRRAIFLSVFFISLSLACFLPVEKAPDERMRYDIAAYIMEHQSLPAGYDEEIRNELWGFSYAFTPYLPSLLAAGIMSLVSLFDSGITAMVIASRLVNVSAAAGCTYMSFQIGDRMFRRPENRLLYTVTISFLPQFIFLSAYLNNDTFAVFSSMLVLYGWLSGRERGWDVRSCIFLGFGISLCALTYYNAYAWILCSVFYYFGTVMQGRRSGKKWKYAIGRGCIIALTVSVLAGWFFVRNALLYDGDFLGMDTMKACGELYAIDALRPSNRATLAGEGKAIWSLFAETEWIKYSIQSFFACFGYLNIWASLKYYICYESVMCASAAGSVYGCAKRKLVSEDWLLYLCCAFCIAIPIILSAANSYSYDYQAQGRYLMPALPALMLCVSKGFEQIDDAVRRKRGYVSLAVCALWIFCFVRIFAKVMIPHLYTGIWAI